MIRIFTLNPTWIQGVVLANWTWKRVKIYRRGSIRMPMSILVHMQAILVYSCHSYVLGYLVQILLTKCYWIWQSNLDSPQDQYHRRTNWTPFVPYDTPVLTYVDDVVWMWCLFWHDSVDLINNTSIRRWFEVSYASTKIGPSQGLLPRN
jgi:hypothetical protein